MLPFALAAVLLFAPALRAQTVKDRLQGVTGRERERIKAQAIAQQAIERSFPAAGGIIRIHSVNNRGDGIVEAIVSYAVGGQPRGLGAQGWAQERIRIQNPPVKTCSGEVCSEDLQGALEEVLAQTVAIAQTGLAPNTPGIGHTTLVVYPDPGSGATTCDGRVRNTGNELSFSSMRTQQTAFADLATGTIGPYVESDTVTDTYDALYREFVHFDTSSLTARATIASATYSVRGSTKSNALGSTDFHVVASTAASANNLVANDFGQVGATSFGSVTYANYSTAGYNDIALNASGIANISKTGVSKFAERTGFDLDNTAPTWASNVGTSLLHYSADDAGTTRDPKLTVVYSLPAGGVLIQNGGF